MPEETIAIKRYPNRRFYSKNASKYVSLPDIEELVQSGATVQIQDNQSGEDITRQVLTQMILDRQPDKMALFPVDMLHLIVRSNDLMADFLRDYFRQSLTYLNYLQRHGAPSPKLANPIHWAKAWLDGISSEKLSPQPAQSPQSSGEASESDREAALHHRVEELEERIRQLEEKGNSI